MNEIFWPEDFLPGTDWLDGLVDAARNATGARP
ncbi:hypothetical protein LMG27952_04325 [Paraburkholderia hiiakae]|uniref:Uncharacterized protein n=1 Tax=Paraburkholderia hiiakae TaxID=1081782 RepID=A0ABM8NVN4_9BURK|nr:hypothetical protein LMG27952_04325 [Paraburkholderia hiiakae]